MNVIIDGDKLIERQLQATHTEEFVVADGIKTQIVPVRYTPSLADPAQALSLDGAWRVKRWPFPTDEAILASSHHA